MKFSILFVVYISKLIYVFSNKIRQKYMVYCKNLYKKIEFFNNKFLTIKIIKFIFNVLFKNFNFFFEETLIIL